RGGGEGEGGGGGVGGRNLEGGGGGAECGQWLGGAENIDQAAADEAGLERGGDDGRAVGGGDDLVADAGNHHAVAVGDQHLAPGGARPGRDHALELDLQAAVGAGFVFQLQPVEPVR